MLKLKEKSEADEKSKAAGSPSHNDVCWDLKFLKLPSYE